jgi:NAD-dependent deacetylase
MTAAIQTISAAELLIVGGTSLSVYPAAGLLRYFHGDALVLINKTETSADSSADLVIREPIGTVLGSFI